MLVDFLATWKDVTSIHMHVAQPYAVKACALAVISLEILRLSFSFVRVRSGCDVVCGENVVVAAGRIFGARSS